MPEPVFRYILGTCRLVEAIDEHGLVELDFRIRRGKHARIHAVWIEPHLLRIQRRRRSV